jgi:hypothetical protein
VHGTAAGDMNCGCGNSKVLSFPLFFDKLRQ